MLDWPHNVTETGRMVRRLPIGAEVQPGGGTHFRVWAPRCERVRVRLQGSGLSSNAEDGNSQDKEPVSSDLGDVCVELTAERGGYFSAFAEQANAGDLYGFLL